MSLPALTLVLLGVAAPPSPAPARPSVPAYTNVDLDRLVPLRGETGAWTVSPAPMGGGPSSPGGKPSTARQPEPAPAEARGEEYWRREAEKLRDRVRPLQEQAAEIRQQISDRQRLPGIRPYSDPGIVALQRKLASLEDRARDLESRLEERARRARALPGWLR